MTRKQKVVDHFLMNPCSCSLSEIEQVLLLHDCVRITAKGSHIKWKHIRLTRDLVIPVHQNECKDFYKKEALKFIKEIRKIN
jgi:predicted RNA binding protein YcfA (HicA-like mRNA interferase family)